MPESNLFPHKSKFKKNASTVFFREFQKTFDILKQIGEFQLKTTTTTMTTISEEKISRNRIENKNRKALILSLFKRDLECSVIWSSSKVLLRWMPQQSLNIFKWNFKCLVQPKNSKNDKQIFFSELSSWASKILYQQIFVPIFGPLLI